MLIQPALRTVPVRAEHAGGRPLGVVRQIKIAGDPIAGQALEGDVLNRVPVTFLLRMANWLELARRRTPLELHAGEDAATDVLGILLPLVLRFVLYSGLGELLGGVLLA
jgi:hypothetical protein